ncbi:hypothetical protein [Actinoallomurus iriomotensis]|uniref:Uncharacterized protein n=1 Tax=Actinoallomurus iriomotensis TaxID=478107 RepID=A0A9W6RCH3_9ACTN|nr:hypothetical protein [Actinoallomurus iriomotensis]GLY73456.1 hypothetical protein Airi01_017230 [Actinoallomurus iriomotensis]
MPPVDSGPVPLGVYRDWPGLDPSERVTMDRHQVRVIADRLTAHLEDLLSADEHLTPASQAAYGAWDAAQAFYPSAKSGHDTLVDQHSRFLHAVLDMIKKLHASAHIYDATESDLERRIAAVDKRLHAVPTTDLFQHDSSGSPPPTAPPNSLNPDARD